MSEDAATTARIATTLLGWGAEEREQLARSIAALIGADRVEYVDPHAWDDARPHA